MFLAYTKKVVNEVFNKYYVETQISQLRHKTILEIDNLILKTYLADVSTESSSPQGEMNLDWVRLYIL